MAVRVKHWGITCQEWERLLEISFGWQSSPALPSQKYLHERLLWLLFQQYPAMLFHGLPAWAGVGRACQHWDFGILSIVSCVWDFVSELHRRAEGSKRGGKDRDVMLDEEKCSSKGLPSFWLVSGCRPLNIIWFTLSFSLCAAPTEPLLCKFADGGQKKRQSQSKYPQNGRPWHREGEVRRHAIAEAAPPQNVSIYRSVLLVLFSTGLSTC